MKSSSHPRRWNDVTIAELMFFEALGSTLAGAKLGSMVQAAKQSGFTHAHSHQTLAKLEGKSRFNRRLVDRQTLGLTPEGWEVLAYARRVLAAYRLKPMQSGRVTLRIAATNRILTTLLASYFPQFIEAYNKQSGNDLNIEILETSFEQALTMLEVGEVELAFGGVNTYNRSHLKLTHTSIRKDLKMVFVAPPKGIGIFTLRKHKEGMKISLKDLKSTNVCLLRRDQRGDFKSLPEPDRGYTRIIVDNYSSVLAFVRAGAALGLVVNFGIPNDMLKFEISDTHPTAQDFAVWQRKGVELSEAANLLHVAVATRRRK